MLNKIYKKHILFAVLIFANGMGFAGNPGDESNGGDLEGTDPASLVGIDKMIYVMIIASVFFAFYIIKKKKL